MDRLVSVPVKHRLTSVDTLRTLMTPCAEADMHTYALGMAVNRAGMEGEGQIEALPAV